MFQKLHQNDIHLSLMNKDKIHKFADGKVNW